MNNSGGFTLIEVLVAVIILSIAFTILAEGFSLVIDTYTRSRNYNFAVRLAEDRLEEIAGGRDISNRGDERDDGQVFYWSVEEQSFPDRENLYKLSITVEWNSGQSSYSAERLIFREN
ncbi:MAG: type IV pilus modification PilV family protein [Halanaerobiaceae bacterium]